jgi:hypothetical protein
MRSSPWLALWFFYHFPMMVVFVASQRFGERTKALATYVGTPVLYLIVFVFTGRRGPGWHPY